MKDESTRNTILFVVSAIALLLIYQFFVLEPAAKRRQAEAKANAPAVATQAAATPGRTAPTTVAGRPVVSRDQAAGASPRIPVATPALKGSISLRGARIDDLYLTEYRQTVSKNAPPVELLRPEGAEHAWFTEFGWAGSNLPGLPTADTVWTLVEGSTLSPGKPITLRYDSGQGLTFTRKISVDEHFMFTVTDTVANTGAGSVTLAPYGSIQRQGIPTDVGKNQIVHEGGIGWLGEDKRELRQFKYPKWLKDGGKTFASVGGWTGITDKYWLTALVPDQKEKVSSEFRITKAGGVNIYESNFLGAPRAIPAGGAITETTMLFAGAKRAPILKDYQTKLGVPEFDRAVDWGMFWFLTRPIFIFLEFIFRHVGNFGVAILLLTVAVRLLFFPLANKQYESITKMKKIQPEMEALRAKFKEDPQKQQQELMALYQREKVNPLAGCLPILFQIPVFYALYKVLTNTIEMRHAPFLGWIQDLSARDPTTIWTLFGLIDWVPASAPFIGGFLDGPLHLGVLPLLYGFTMWLTTAMSPPAGDPMQQRIFQLMPIFFTFIMAPFAVGLLIYWTWSNVISILQQYVIMRRFKVDNPIDQIIARLSGRAKASG